MKVYIIYGSQGDYDEAHEWIVAAYSDKAKADLHVNKLNDRAKELGILEHECAKLPISYEKRQELVQQMRPLDNVIDYINHSGLYKYVAEEIDVWENVP